MSAIASASLQQLLKLAQHERLLQVQGLRGSSRSFVAASLAHSLPGPLLVITPTPELAEQLLRELPLFSKPVAFPCAPSPTRPGMLSPTKDSRPTPTLPKIGSKPSTCCCMSLSAC